jgi:hypothetical protein
MHAKPPAEREVPEKMTDGVIIGGWGYVIAAYSITILGLLLFAWSLKARLGEAHQAEVQPKEESEL